MYDASNHYSIKISVAAISTNILQMNDYIKYKCLNFFGAAELCSSFQRRSHFQESFGL